MHLAIPPLRERKKDIYIYAKQLLKELSRGRTLEFSRGALRILEEYQWAGNIRELRNVMERIVAIAQYEIISAAFVKKLLGAETKINHDYTSGEAKEIIAALHSCEGRIGDAAKALNISRSTLWRKMNNLGIKTNDYKRSS